jgi:hypothetical protein
MGTSDYAFILSILSLVVAFCALAWNVWQKFIFVKPSIQVTFGLWNLLSPRDEENYQADGRKLFVLSATNMGPGPAILTMCIIKRHSPGSWLHKEYGSINPIDGDPAALKPTSSGPFSGGLPAKLEAGEEKSFYFPYEQSCLMSARPLLVGVLDSYRRKNWCRRSDITNIAKAYKKDLKREDSERI